MVKVANEGLIPGSDDLVQSEFKITDDIMALIIVDVVEVVNIINDDFVGFTHLKIILHVKLLDPLRVQIVHDHLGVADFEPRLAREFVQNGHAVGSRESIHIRQILTLEGETDRVGEPHLPLLQSLVDSGEDSVIKVSTSLHDAERSVHVVMRATTSADITDDGGGCSHRNFLL